MMNDVHELARRVAERLGQTPGVEAVTLGGLWAYPNAPLDADLDIYLYYRAATPPDAQALGGQLRAEQAEVADAALPDLLDPNMPLATWLWIEGHRIALHYRSVEAVTQAVEAGLAGELDGVYRPGQLHAVFSATLMGEVHDARVLYDPFGTLGELRGLTDPYPYELRRAVLIAFGAEADRVLFTAQQALGADDVYAAAAALMRGAACVVQILFAANGRYLAYERGVLHRLGELPDRPGDAERVIARALGAGPPYSALAERIEELRALVGEVRLRYVQPVQAGG